MQWAGGGAAAGPSGKPGASLTSASSAMVDARMAAGFAASPAAGPGPGPAPASGPRRALSAAATAGNVEKRRARPRPAAPAPGPGAKRQRTAGPRKPAPAPEGRFAAYVADRKCARVDRGIAWRITALTRTRPPRECIQELRLTLDPPVSLSVLSGCDANADAGGADPAAQLVIGYSTAADTRPSLAAVALLDGRQWADAAAEAGADGDSAPATVAHCCAAGPGAPECWLLQLPHVMVELLADPRASDGAAAVTAPIAAITWQCIDWNVTPYRPADVKWRVAVEWDPAAVEPASDDADDGLAQRWRGLGPTHPIWERALAQVGGDRRGLSAVKQRTSVWHGARAQRLGSSTAPRMLDMFYESGLVEAPGFMRKAREAARKRARDPEAAAAWEAKRKPREDDKVPDGYSTADMKVGTLGEEMVIQMALRAMPTLMYAECGWRDHPSLAGVGGSADGMLRDEAHTAAEASQRSPPGLWAAYRRSGCAPLSGPRADEYWRRGVLEVKLRARSSGVAAYHVCQAYMHMLTNQCHWCLLVIYNLDHAMLSCHRLYRDPAVAAALSRLLPNPRLRAWAQTARTARYGGGAGGPSDPAAAVAAMPAGERAALEAALNGPDARAVRAACESEARAMSAPSGASPMRSLIVQQPRGRKPRKRRGCADIERVALLRTEPDWRRYEAYAAAYTLPREDVGERERAVLESGFAPEDDESHTSDAWAALNDAAQRSRTDAAALLARIWDQWDHVRDLMRGRGRGFDIGRAAGPEQRAAWRELHARLLMLRDEAAELVDASRAYGQRHCEHVDGASDDDDDDDEHEEDEDGE